MEWERKRYVGRGGVLARPVPSPALLKRNPEQHGYVDRAGSTVETYSQAEEVDGCEEGRRQSRGVSCIPSSSLKRGSGSPLLQSLWTQHKVVDADRLSYESHGQRLERENRKLKSELAAALERLETLEELTATLLVKRCLPPYDEFLPPYFVRQHRDVLAAVDVYASQYHDRVKHLLRHPTQADDTAVCTGDTTSSSPP